MLSILWLSLNVEQWDGEQECQLCNIEDVKRFILEGKVYIKGVFELSHR